MRKSPVRSGLAIAGCFAIVLTGCSSTPDSSDTSSAPSDASAAGKYTTREVSDGETTFTVVENPADGKTLSFSAESGMKLIEEVSDGSTFAFKDMNGNGTLDKWEDWRLSAEERAADVAPQLTKEQIAGLMLFSPHERAPGDGLTDEQKEYLEQADVRNVLHAGGNNIEDSVLWSNQIQAFVEGLDSTSPYVPVGFSSDPRSDAVDSYTGAEGGDISQWPGNLGLSATFDPEIVDDFARITSEEFRALGLTVALGPQIDLASDPRYIRSNGTFGEDPDHVSEVVTGYVEGYQNTFDADGKPVGWGDQSVVTFIKHFAGDGASEGGRGSHMDTGKYSVFPGDSFADHVKPFVAGITSGGVMTSYVIATDGEGEPLFGNSVGTAFDKNRVDILREDNGYDGVIVTDWNVMKHANDPDNAMKWGEAWGVEDLTTNERFYEALKAGIDMYGGESDSAPVLAAYDMWDADFKAGNLDVDADARFAQSATRIVTNLYHTGVYDNPYLDLEVSKAMAGTPDKIAAGWDAQLNSVVMLKNANGTIAAADDQKLSDKTVYIPSSQDLGHNGAFGPGVYTQGPTIDIDAAKEVFANVITDEVELDADGKVISTTAPDLSDVDLVLVGMRSPNNGDVADGAGKNLETGEWLPLSLQYRPYTADGENVRKVSIAGDVLADGSQENRTYFGATSNVSNEADLDAFERAVAAVEKTGKDIPVVAVLKAKNPVIPAEFEQKADAIITGFGVSDKALLTIAAGQHEPKGRLPITFPASMDAVEGSLEDVPGDVAAYVDSEGNEYAFGFGLSWNGTPIK